MRAAASFGHTYESVSAYKEESASQNLTAFREDMRVCMNRVHAILDEFLLDKYVEINYDPTKKEMHLCSKPDYSIIVEQPTVAIDEGKGSFKLKITRRVTELPIIESHSSPRAPLIKAMPY